KAWKQNSRKALTPHDHEESVGFERDDAPATKELREPQTLKQRRHLARVIERPDGAVVVLEGDHHALRPAVGVASGRGRPEAFDSDDSRTETGRQMQPVNAFLEEGIAAGHGFVVAPV